MTEKKKDFVYGAFVLALSGFLVKLIGAVFRIPLTNLVGTTAMGYFSSAYSVYIVLLSLATSGMPTGIAVMVSRALALGKPRDVGKTLRVAGTAFISLGAIISTLGVIFARPIATFMNSADAYYAMVALMPAVFCISVVALFKGYFQGFNNMVPTATSNLIEAAVKLCAGYGIAYWMIQNGYPPEQAVGGAIAGITLSTVCAMCFMVLRYLLRGSKYRLKFDRFTAAATATPLLVKEFFGTALPLMISSITSNLMGAIDSFLVMNRLTSYLSEDQANLLWGAFGNMTLTIFNLPSFLIVAIGTSLVPGIAAAFARKEFDTVKSYVNRSLKMSLTLSCACAFGINAVAKPLLQLLFRDGNAIPHAAQCLQIICFVLISVGFTTVTAAILNSVKKAHLSVVSVAVGGCIKTLFTFIFVSFPALNIYGAPMATNLAYPVIAILNLYFIRKHLGVSPDLKTVLLKPLLAGVCCFATAKIYLFLGGLISDSRLMVLPVIALTAITYVGIILGLKLFTKDELLGVFRRRSRQK